MESRSGGTTSARTRGPRGPRGSAAVPLHPYTAAPQGAPSPGTAADTGRRRPDPAPGTQALPQAPGRRLRTDTPCAGATASGRGPASWAGWAKDRVGLGDFLTKAHTELEARQLVNVAKETGGGPWGKGDPRRHSTARSGMAQGSLWGQRQKLPVPCDREQEARHPRPFLLRHFARHSQSSRRAHILLTWTRMSGGGRRMFTRISPTTGTRPRHPRAATDYWGHHSHGTQGPPTSLDSRTKPEVPDFMQRSHPEDCPREPLLAPAGQ